MRERGGEKSGTSIFSLPTDCDLIYQIAISYFECFHNGNRDEKKNNIEIRIGSIH